MNKLFRTSTASGRLTTIMNLSNRNVHPKEVAWEDPASFESVWNELRAIFPTAGSKRLVSAHAAKLRLTAVMKASYVGEKEFHSALFHALRCCFSSYVVKRQDPRRKAVKKTYENNFLLEVCNLHGNYAVGIARNVSCTRGLIPRNENETISGLSAGCEVDLGSCLFEKDDDERWIATDVFSVVELKTSDSSCVEFEVINNTVLAFDFEVKYAPFAQVLLYVLGGVLLYLARNGVMRDIDFANQEAHESKKLPLAVIAGKVDSKAGKSKKILWVSGYLVIPKACGDTIEYGVNSFGNFCSDHDAEERCIDKALSVCVGALLFGIRAAKRVLRQRFEPYQPHPRSGMNLLIGAHHLNWPVRASPIPLPRCSGGPSQTNQTIVVSQGDLFCGELNVHETLATSELGKGNFVELDTSGIRVPVHIKVFSSTVDSTLIDKSAAFDAIVKSKAVLAAIRDRIPHHRCCLLGAVWAPSGLTTISSDLADEGYTILSPQRCNLNLLALWKGFRNLVTEVLLPLAHKDCGVVHADIRPGFDITSSIVFKEVDGGNVQMALVDYESLVFLEGYRTPASLHGHIQNRSQWTATTFVWWQCIYIAYAWLEERCVYRSGVKDTTKMAVLTILQIGPNLAWLPSAVRQSALDTKIGEAAVLSMLSVLDGIFQQRDMLRIDQKLSRERTLQRLVEMASG